MKAYTAYAISILIIVFSVLLIYLLPISSEYRNLFSFPAIFGLFSILIQGWRDQIAHERAIELQRREHDFVLGTASHLANVVFDKQVAFAERYSSELWKILEDISEKGFLSEDVMNYQKQLQDIRLKFAPWISSELRKKLEPYENAFEAIGMKLRKAKMLDSSPYSRNRAESSELISDAYGMYAEFIGISEGEASENMVDTPTQILEHLRKTLGIGDLEELRQRALEAAKSAIK